MSDMVGEEDASLQENNNTLSEDSQMENEEDYTLPDGSVVKAIRHVHLRTELLKAAEARCHWTHPQPHGDAPDDRTAPVAFPADQLDVSNILHSLISACLACQSIRCIPESNDQLPCACMVHDQE